jgi:hypothetical protein
VVADNSGLAVSHDGRRLAFAAGRSAREWELPTARVRRRWQLPPGLTDALAYARSGRLMLYRMETASGLPPYGAADYRTHPRLFVGRELGEGGPRELVRSGFLNQRIHWSVAAPDGSCFVAVGERDGPRGKSNWVQAFGGATGQALWAAPGHSLLLTPGGDVLAYVGEQHDVVLVRPTSGQVLGRRRRGGGCLSPGLALVGTPGDSGWGYSVNRGDDPAPLVTLGIDRRVSSVLRSFSPDGQRLAWGNADGTVALCKLAEARRRLAAVGLGWDE